MYTWQSILLIVYLFWQILPEAQAQKHILNTQFFSIEDGLSHRDVQCIHQDQQGFIWLGTNYGLNRFDGYQFKWFTKEKHGLQSNTINHIVADGDGLMWLFNTTNRIFQTPLSIDIFDPTTGEVVSFEKKFEKSAPFPIHHIFSFAAAADGRIFFSTIKGQLFIYTPGKGFEARQLSLRYFILHSFSAHKTIWGYAYNKDTEIREAVVEIDFNGKVLRRYDPGYPIQNTFIAGADRTENLWYIIKRNGPKPPDYSEGLLYRITPQGGSEQFIQPQKNWPIDSLDLDRVEFGGGFQIWIHPTQGFLYLFSRNSFQVFHPEKGWYFEVEPAHKFLAYTNTVFFDRKGNAWAGTSFGLYRIEISLNPFSQILADKNEDDFRAFRGITEDAAGNLWASNDRGDGWLWEIKKQNHQYQVRDIRATNPVVTDSLEYKYALFTDRKGCLWFGSGPPKLIIKYDPRTNTHQTFPLNIPRKIETRQVNIWSFYEDDNGLLWFGTDTGVIGYLDEKQQVIILPELAGVNAAGGCIYQFQKDNTGQLWLATDKGLFQVNTETKAITPYPPKMGKVPWEGVFFINLDPDGSFWLATKGQGLFHLNLETGAFEQFTKADGLSNNTIYAVYRDDFNNLWLPSDYGIIRFNQNTRRTKAYLKKDGITHNEFNRISHCKAADGAFYFGSLNGITAFHPKDFQADGFDLDIPLVITEFQQFIGRENKLQDKKNELLKSRTITIYPEDRFFLLEFALLTFDDVENMQYAYKLEGEDANWTYQKENAIRMSGLPYGRHQLRIKGQEPNGHWSEEELLILVIVLKPFYLRTGFLLVAVLLLLFSGLLILRWRTANLKRTQAKLEAEVNRQTATIRQQAEELKAVDEFKSRFFANVSHELRTPLTLILGPLNALMSSGAFDKKSLGLLELAQSNARGLLKMVSSILDLTKIEAHKLDIHETIHGLFPLTRRFASAFESHAECLGIHYLFEYHADQHLRLKLDAARLETIVNNLLSNAMKFTPKGGMVAFLVDDCSHAIRITIKDTGKGIHPSDIPHVFDRFYQSKEPGTPIEGGTGIGLTLCKELANLMGGHISVTSEWQKGSVFILEIPRKEVLGVNIPEPDQYEILAEPAFDSLENNTYGEQGYLLLVEDNYSLRAFLETILAPHYQVRTAANGAEALELLPGCMATPVWQQQGGVILSDIMMPVMDGFQLLNYLKANTQYAHIPVIMLTARADIKDKLAALRTGVDDYLLKPFVQEELLARIANLLQNYRKRNTSPDEFAGKTILEPGLKAPVISPEDLAWLGELEAKVHAFVKNDLLSVHWIAGQVFLSERQLHRRLKAITGLSPQEYIREMRLQEARHLLENRLVDSVKKVAHTVCFHDEKYFARIYKARFGKSPSEALG